MADAIDCVVCHGPRDIDSGSFCTKHKEEFRNRKYPRRWTFERMRSTYALEAREAMMAYGLEVPTCVNSRRCEDPC